MKFYYPKDKNGNTIGFKTPESMVYDTSGKSLTDKLASKMDMTSSEYIKGLTISGKTITYTKGDGSRGTLTTQDTTYSNFVKSGSGAKAGLVPAPSTTAGTTKYLREDGSWQVPPDNNTTYSNFVKSGSGAKPGLVPAPPTTAGTTKYLREDGTWQVPPDDNTTYSNFVKSGSGAKSGLVPAPSTTAGTTKYLREDGTWAVPPGSNTITLSTLGVTATANELNYMDGVTGVKNGTTPTSTTHGTGDKHLINSAFLSYWNGAYSTNGTSNLAYCNKGAFGDAATKSVTTSIANGSSDLITSGAVYTGLAGKADVGHNHTNVVAPQAVYGAAMQDDGNFVVLKMADGTPIFDTASTKIALNNKPDKNGTGATGTWDINVTGSAASATKANPSALADTTLKNIKITHVDLVEDQSALTSGLIYMVY